jgi:hypothetical protein
MSIARLAQVASRLEKEIRLLRQDLISLLPDRDPTEKRPIYLINPYTGKKERVA